MLGYANLQIAKRLIKTTTDFLVSRVNLNFNLKKNKTTSCTFSGWGGSDKGHWKSGTYRFEFFYRGKSIGSKWFTIY